MWSYPAVYRDQGRKNGKGDGKELCDLLVVFDNHVIIFSDKDCCFKSGDLDIAWPRWFRKAVMKSAGQWGAQRWIRDYPNLIFLDRGCSQPFPVSFPDPDKAIFHRIVVAHDAARACEQVLGGSGSLMLDNSIVGDMHFSFFPFTIGRLDETKGYVHVFDDTTLDIVMSTLDTITDFTEYLTKKEKLLDGDRMVRAAGEEEILAVYLSKMNEAGEHDFVIEGNPTRLIFGEGMWESFNQRPEPIAQTEANHISYLWDHLIERFGFHAMTGTQYFTSGRPFRDQEVAFRFLAREPRLLRRVLSEGFREALIESTKKELGFHARVVGPLDEDGPWYVFLFLEWRSGMSEAEYREVRRLRLLEYSHVVKLKYPQALDIVGIATEASLAEGRSEDFTYLDARRWTPNHQRMAREIQDRFGFLKKVESTAFRVYEYPVDENGNPRSD